MNTTPSNTVDTAVNSRIQEWRAAVDQEFSDLVNTAAEYRKAINNAKTQTKKSYYEKKFKRISADIVRMVTIADRLKNQQQAIEAEQATEQGAAETTA